MPIHDWTRVDAGTFHSFHQDWTIEICRTLNRGLLPPDYLAMTDQRVDGPEPEDYSPSRCPGESGWAGGRGCPSARDRSRGSNWSRRPTPDVARSGDTRLNCGSASRRGTETGTKRRRTTYVLHVPASQWPVLQD